MVYHSNIRSRIKSENFLVLLAMQADPTFCLFVCCCLFVCLFVVVVSDVVSSVVSDAVSDVVSGFFWHLFHWREIEHRYQQEPSRLLG